MMPFGTLRLSGRIQELKRIGNTACLTLAVIALTGCGLLPFGNKKDTQSPAPMPPMQTANAETVAIPTTDGTMLSAESPQAMPQNADTSSPKGYVQVPVPPPELSPPLDPVIAAGRLQLGDDGPMGALGLNLNEYFDERADMETRVKRVERAVTAIQTDLKTLAPPLKRLITVERDIQELVAQLADFVAEPPAPPPVEPVQATYMPPPQSPTPMGRGAISANAPSMSINKNANIISGGNSAGMGAPVNVLKLRTGEHPDMSRIVIDVTGKPTYRYDLDNNEKLLVIDLQGASWSGPKQGTPKKSPMIASYNVYDMQGGGSRVVIQLKKNTTIKYEGVYRPNGKPHYRIVLDLKK